MTRAVPLSEFMPYGAPDLLAAGPAHLARAVFASSALVIAAFFVLLLGLSFAPHGAATTHETTVIIFRGSSALPPPLDLPRPAPAHTKVAWHPSSGAVVPVAGGIFPDAPPEAGPPGDATQPGDATTTSGGATGSLAPPAPSVVPRMDDFVYTDQLPVVIRDPRPEYPDIAQQAGVDGVVLVHILIDLDGRVADARVDPKFSVPLLNDFALEAARRWTFHPALANGHPVMVWETIPFRFTLHR